MNEWTDERQREREKLFSNVKVASHCSGIFSFSLFFLLLRSMLKKREEEEEKRTTGERPTVGDEKWKEEGRRRRRERRRQRSRRGEFLLFLSFYTSALFCRAFNLARAFFSSCGRRPALRPPRRSRRRRRRERGHDAVATSTFRDTFALLVWRGKKARHPSFIKTQEKRNQPQRVIHLFALVSAPVSFLTQLNGNYADVAQSFVPIELRCAGGWARTRRSYPSCQQ